MKKEYLRKTYQTVATDEMMKMAENDHLVKEKTWYGAVVENYKTDIYMRCQVIERILKVSFFQTHDMRMGSNKPAYELYIDKDTGRFFTWDTARRKWKTAILDHMDWIFYDRISRSYMAPEDSLLMKQYLDVAEDGYNGISNYQNDVRERQLKERHRRETEPWDFVMSRVPALPKDWERWVDKQAIHYNYIFYDYSRKKIQTGYCSWCEKEVPIKKPKHNKMGKCPCCRHTIQYKAKGRTGRFETAAETAYLLQPCGDDVVLRQFKVLRHYAKGGYETPKLYIFEERRVIYNSAMESSRFYYGLYKNSYSRWIKGERVSYNPYRMYYYDNRDYEGAVYRRNLLYLARTKLSRTGLSELIRQSDRLDPEVYLETLREKPYLEQLAKAGLIMVVKDILGGKRELEIDSSHDFAKALGIDKNQMRRLRKDKGGFQYLAWLKYEKQNKKNYPDQMLKQLEQWQAEPSDLGFILKKMSLVRICNYLKKQSALSGRPVKELISTWRDYLFMASRLKADTEAELVFKPKDLVAKHDETVSLCGGEEIVKQAEEILEHYPDIDSICRSIQEKYEYGDKQYTIIVPKTVEDILVEGAVLGHCLDRTDIYFGRIQRRESFIVFLRKTEALDCPYYTLEIEPDGTARQKRTTGDKQNADFNKAKRFIMKWQREIQKRLTEEDFILAKESIRLRKKEFKELRETKAKIWHGHLAGKLLVDVLEADLMEAVSSMGEEWEGEKADLSAAA